MYKQINEHIGFTLEDNIMVARYTSGSYIDLDIAKKIVNDRLKFFDGISYPCLVDSRGVTNIEFTKEARDYLAKEGMEGVKALGILADTLITLIIGNIFKTFSQPGAPTQIFITKEGAIRWLKEFV